MGNYFTRNCLSPSPYLVMKKFLIPIMVSAIALLLVLATGAANQGPRFGLPLQCPLGQNCFVLLYSDRDPSPNEVDFGCGRMTYDGHTGTDFAIPDERVMAQGVPAIAAADGKVLRVRDGVEDRQSTGLGDPNVKGKECGNGVVIDHGQGWQTQYCHLRQNSVVVKSGDRVKTGTKLGLVGQSGLATFPHVHFEPRFEGKPVDPFLGVNPPSGCKVSGKSMWQSNLAYVPTGIVNAGFVDREPKIKEAEKGSIANAKLSSDSAALIFWVRSYGVLKGDRQSLKIIAPDRSIFASDDRTLEKPNRILFTYAGKRNRAKLLSGKWRGEYKLTRDGKLLIDTSRELEVR